MVVLPRRYREYSASVGNQLADVGRGAPGGIFPPPYYRFNKLGETQLGADTNSVFHHP